MGRRGPPKKPTALRLQQGNPGRLPILREPKPEKGPPAMPEWLDTYARECWKCLIPQLDEMGILARVDGFALAGLSSSYSMWRQASEWIQQNGMVFAVRGDPTLDNPKGPIKYMQQWPQVSIAQKALKQMHGFLAEFGLTPAARARLELPHERPAEDDIDRRYFGTIPAAAPDEDEEETVN